MAQRTDLTLPTLTAPVRSAGGPLSARDQRERLNLGRSSATQSLSYAHEDHIHPCPPPIPVGQRAEMITCLCFVKHSQPCPAAPLRQQRCTGRSASIRRANRHFQNANIPLQSQNRLITFATHPHGTTFY